MRSNQASFLTLKIRRYKKTALRRFLLNDNFKQQIIVVDALLGTE